MPVLPMVLVNGAEGIGTGWSTFIPNYNPRDIVANLRRLLAGEPQAPMQPWYKGFKGAIQEVPTKTAGKSYTLNGIISQVRAMRVVLAIIIGWYCDYVPFCRKVEVTSCLVNAYLCRQYKSFRAPVQKQNV